MRTALFACDASAALRRRTALTIAADATRDAAASRPIIDGRPGFGAEIWFTDLTDIGGVDGVGSEALASDLAPAGETGSGQIAAISERATTTTTANLVVVRAADRVVIGRPGSGFEHRIANLASVVGIDCRLGELPTIDVAGWLFALTPRFTANLGLGATGTAATQLIWSTLGPILKWVVDALDIDTLPGFAEAGGGVGQGAGLAIPNRHPDGPRIPGGCGQADLAGIALTELPELKDVAFDQAGCRGTDTVGARSHAATRLTVIAAITCPVEGVSSGCFSFSFLLCLLRRARGVPFRALCFAFGFFLGTFCFAFGFPRCSFRFELRPFSLSLRVPLRAFFFLVLFVSLGCHWYGMGQRCRDSGQ